MMTENQDQIDDLLPELAADRTSGEIKFEYIKSNLFRVVHVDGVIGGLTPKLDIHAALWSERFPIPQQTTQELKSDGRLGDEIVEKRIGRRAIVREVEASLLMNLETAKMFAEWLNQAVKTAEDAQHEGEELVESELGKENDERG